MPWSENRYPAAMKNLPLRVRRKAIEIANALLAEGCEEGRAIRIAIWRAKRWCAAPARNRL
jgi:uncharacterized protein YdaT